MKQIIFLFTITLLLTCASTKGKMDVVGDVDKDDKESHVGVGLKFPIEDKK